MVNYRITYTPKDGRGYNPRQRGGGQCSLKCLHILIIHHSLCHPAPQTKSVRYIGILCNLKNSSHLYSIHIHTRPVVLYRTYVSINYPTNRFYSIDSSNTSNGRLKRERMPFAVAKMTGERIIRRSNRFLPGKSLRISPVKIVKTPCPGTPGTDRSIPTMISIPPNRFFRADRQIRKTGFLMRRSRFKRFEIVWRQGRD